MARNARTAHFDVTCVSNGHKAGQFWDGYGSGMPDFTAGMISGKAVALTDTPSRPSHIW